MKILYHAHCADGFCAAFLAWKRFGDAATYIPVSYGDPMPDCGSEDVIIVDFSYPPEEIARLRGKVTMLDHHKTAAANFEGVQFGDNVTVKFDMDKCGARLMMEYLGDPTGTEQRLVDYVEDRDLWRWKLPNSREVSAAIASYPQDFEVWSGFYMPSLIEEGRAILRYQKQQVERIVSSAVLVAGCYVGEGDVFAKVNSSVLQSEVGEHLCKNGVRTTDGSMAAVAYADVWYDSPKGRVHSLRSIGSFDVSSIARAWGGGGHQNAAGYLEPL